MLLFEDCTLCGSLSCVRSGCRERRGGEASACPGQVRQRTAESELASAQDSAHTLEEVSGAGIPSGGGRRGHQFRGEDVWRCVEGWGLLEVC